MNMAARLGLTNVASVPRNNRGPAMALGTNDETLLNMTSAYATFANGGVRMPTVAIRKITDSEGHIIYQYHDQHPHGVRVMRQDIAYLMSSILSDKAARYEEFGPGNPLELDRPAAAKTGTTDDFRDNWTLGYTPHLAVGVWAGNSDDTQMNNVIGITGAGPIWHDVMEYASHAYHFPADDFVRPADVHQAAVSALTGLAPYPGDVTVRDWFIDGTVPTIRGWGSYGLPAAPTQKSPAHSSDKDPWQIGPWKIDPWKLIPWFDPHTGNADW
jgi:membrane peptidoglycan carboxypeptidase